MRTPELAAVVVAWNSADSLAACLGALQTSASAGGADLELVVVDNGSSDGSPEAARQAGADLVIENPRNAGFGVAASQGIACAAAPWALLLNPDVVVREAFVVELLAAAASAPRDVATLVPDLRFASDPEIVNCRGVGVDALGIPLELEAGVRATAAARTPPALLGGTTGCCAYRRSALEAVGGLEPVFFAYLEDVDVAWRLAQGGYRALFVPGAVAEHELSISTGEGSWYKTYLVARSRRLLFALDAPRGPRERLLRTITDLGHGLVATGSGAGTAPWRGRAAALRSRGYVRFLRRSRAQSGAPAATPPIAARVGLRETLSRKRRIASHAAQRDGSGQG